VSVHGRPWGLLASIDECGELTRDIECFFYLRKHIDKVRLKYKRLMKFNDSYTSSVLFIILLAFPFLAVHFITVFIYSLIGFGRTFGFHTYTEHKVLCVISDGFEMRCYCHLIFPLESIRSHDMMNMTAGISFRLVMKSEQSSD